MAGEGWVRYRDRHPADPPGYTLKALHLQTKVEPSRYTERQFSTSTIHPTEWVEMYTYLRGRLEESGEKLMAKFDLKNFAPKKAVDVGVPRSILIFGPPKRGKSTCAASIVDVPSYERVLVVDVEGGAAAISQWYPEVDVFEISTALEFDGFIEALVNGQVVEPTSGKPYDCVIIDTLDKAQERKLEWFDQQPEALTKGGEKNTLYKWGAIKTWTTKLADALHMAPFLTIFVAHVMDDKDEKTGKVTQTVALGGQSKFNFPATPDLVGYFDVARVKNEAGVTETVRTMDFSVTDKRVTGQRYADKLDGVVANPTMETIYKKIAPQLFKSDKKDSVTKK